MNHRTVVAIFAILAIGEHRVDRDRTVHSFDASSDGPNVSSKNSTIAIRSNRDRGPFVEESIPRSSGGVFLRIGSAIDAQSTHDQAMIMPRSGHDRVPILGVFEAKF